MRLRRESHEARVRAPMTGLLVRLSAALAGRYRIERELGQGGMATVYLAGDLKHRPRRASGVTWYNSTEQ